jgi:methyl-accepting chemotaxis protein
MKRTMKLGTRIALGFTGVLLLLMIIIGFALYNMSILNGQMRKIVEENFNKIELTFDLKEQFSELNTSLAKLFVVNNAEREQEIIKGFDNIRENYNKVYDELLKTPNRTEKGQILREKIKEAVENAKPINNQVIELVKDNRKLEAADLLISEAGPATEKIVSAADEYLALLEEYNQTEVKSAEQAFNNSLMLMFALGIIGIILGIVITIFITRGITKSINRVVDSLTEGSNQVAAASNQLSASSQQLAEGSAEQSTSLEETSSTLEESTSMIQQITENTKQAALLSDQAKEAVDKGNLEMQEMTESMNEIKKSSDQISKVIKVIDDIAFQTNILALNAAVEAARAGEAGMGFAVVAEEVRNLAQRSAQAAKDTAEMIENNIELSEKGVNVTKRVQEALVEVTAQAKKINDIMEEIAASSQEQSQGISQINSAIAQMETVVQQNAANAEESASASEELSAQANNLKDIVKQLVILVHGKIDQKYEDMLRNEHKQYNNKNHTNRDYESVVINKQIQHAQAPVKQLPDYKTKLVSPEEVIPLDKDNKGF